MRTIASALLLTSLLCRATSPSPGAAAPAAATAILTRGPYLQNATPHAITVRWRTDVPTSSRVWVGGVPGSYIHAASDPALTTEHEVRLTGLSPATTHHYAIGSMEGMLAGSDASYRFVTSPAAGQSHPTRVWVLGDSGTPSGGQARVRDAYLAFAGERRTDVWLMLGDNAYESGSDSDFSAGLFVPFDDFLRGHSLWLTRGNHDDPHVGAFNDYYELFTLPAAGDAGGVASGTEAWYSFDYGDIHFVCLDSEGAAPTAGGPMLAWLAADLGSTARTWVIAFWHRPPYSKGSHDSDSEERMIEMRENVMPILEAHGVDLVLTGHSHSYERSFLIDGHYGPSETLAPSMILDGGDGDVRGDGDYRKPAGSPGPHQGEVVVVAGASSTLASGPLDHPAMARSVAALGSVVIDVHGNLLEALYLDDQGVVRDRFAIRKGDVIDVGEGGPRALSLRVAGRNPAPRGAIDFACTLPRPGWARLAVFDVTGRIVRALSLEADAPGTRVATWDGRDTAGREVPRGIYFAVLRFGGESRTARVAVVP